MGFGFSFLEARGEGREVSKARSGIGRRVVVVVVVVVVVEGDEYKGCVRSKVTCRSSNFLFRSLLLSFDSFSLLFRWEKVSARLEFS